MRQGNKPGDFGRHPGRRRGSVKAGLMIAMLAGGLVGTAMIAIRPRTIGASVPESAAVGPQRTVAIEALADLLGRSAGIVAVHRRDGSPFTDVVVHAFDDHRRGVIEAPEVLVLTHSRTLRAVMAFAMDPVAIDDASRRESVDRTTLESPEFARRWRERPDVRRTVLAAGEGVVDLELIPEASRGYRTSSVWTLRLTWADRSADGTVTAELPVEPVADGLRDRE
jgi:hypothetical protein